MGKKLIAGVLAIGVVFGFMAWQRYTRAKLPAVEAQKSLNVGFLPVTCHLTCPVTDFATKSSRRYRFVSQRFTDFATVTDAFKAGALKATFFVAPLAMKLRAQGIPAKIVYLGHRDGSTVMVRKNDPAKSLRDLKGKRFAIPTRYSNQYLVTRKLMNDQGLKPEDLVFVELPPPEMPSALANGSIDAYFVGEPHAAKAELDGTGRVLYHAKDIWPKFISCVLVVHEDLIRDDPQLVAELVRGIAESGEWAEQNREKAADLVAPYFRQDAKVIKYALTQPIDRVSYRMLSPTDLELGAIHNMAREAGLLEKDILMSDLLDRRFIPKDIVPAAI
jgi:NitT/TauT family transport system substrate-binding protein